jgi:hypothetical protein
MKELAQNFVGRGEVSGFMFRQLARNKQGYLYEVRQLVGKKPHFEVFRRRENERFDLVSYPRSNSFGAWAWTFVDIEAARKKLDEL